ncbi:hypothetical protein M3Y98_01197600 [Aphelenchoides besseyi]|nr:hypothetical protein M3Y98_01197600 [Aphelenchoides besseyi]KAI6193146.1 hypothetical protein M3Y96_00987300 [Aphelenchoides besseyi]
MVRFSLNATTGRNILELANDRDSSAYVRKIYYYWIMCFSLASMTLNALLCVAICCFPNSLIKINPMLLCNSIVDYLLASTYFFFGHYLFVGYDRLFTIFLGFVHVTDPKTFQYVIFVEQMILIANWNIVIAQTRLFSNKQPSGRRLYWFFTFCFLHYVSNLYFNLKAYSGHMSAEDLEDSVSIVRYYAIEVTSNNIYGKMVIPEKMTVNDYIPTLYSLCGFILIVYCSISIRRILRQSSGMKVAITRRLNQSMDRTILSIGGIVMFTNVFPNIGFAVAYSRCQSNAIFSLVVSTCILSSAFLNPVQVITAENR